MNTDSGDGTHETLSALILRWSDSEEEILDRVYRDHLQRLHALSRKTLQRFPAAEAEAEDVVQSAIKSLCRYFRKPENTQDKQSADFWRFLSYLVIRKSRRRLTRQTRGLARGRLRPMTDVVNEEADSKVQELMAGISPEEFDVLVTESLEGLAERLRPVALLMIEGYSVVEAAQRLNCSTRTISRKLQLIREELGNALNTSE